MFLPRPIESIGTTVEQTRHTVALFLQSKTAALIHGGFDAMTPALGHPFVNRVKHALGMKCQSIVWNRTSKVVYVIVTDRTIKTSKTKNTHAKLDPSYQGISVASACVANTSQVEEGATPPQMKTIPPGECHLFNLDSSDYYLTYYTLVDQDEKEGEVTTRRAVFHDVNLKVRGDNDYVVLPEYLENYVELSELDQTTMSLVANHTWKP